MDRNDHNRLYAFRFDSSPSVHRTFDGGASWQPADAGLGSNIVYRVVPDPNDFSVVYAATSGGLYRSTDAGDTWTLLASGPVIYDVDVDRFDSRHIVRAEQSEYKVQRSVDGGQTWEPITRTSFGLSRDVEFDYTGPSSLMAGVDSGGVEVIQIAPDLEIASSTSAIAQNSPRSVRVDLRNRGPYAATRVVLTVSVPRAGTKVQTPRGTCAPIGTTGSVRCDVGVVRADELVPVTFSLPELFAGDPDVRFEVAGREPDVASANNSLSLAVQRRSDLGLAMTASATRVVQDQPVTLILTITNGDFSPAEDVRIFVQLAAGLELSGITPSTALCAGFGGTPGGNMTCSIGSLTRHSSTEVRVTAIARQTGSPVASASVSSQGTDPDPDNNAAAMTINVVAPQTQSGGGGGGGGGSLTWTMVLMLGGLAVGRRRWCSRPSA